MGKVEGVGLTEAVAVPRLAEAVSDSVGGGCDRCAGARSDRTTLAAHVRPQSPCPTHVAGTHAVTAARLGHVPLLQAAARRGAGVAETVGRAGTVQGACGTRGADTAARSAGVGSAVVIGAAGVTISTLAHTFAAAKQA